MSAVALSVMMAGVAACGGGQQPNPFAIKKGMTQPKTIATAGRPFRRGGPYGRHCSFYRASKKGTSIDGMRVCFKQGRVSVVQTAVHG